VYRILLAVALLACTEEPSAPPPPATRIRSEPAPAETGPRPQPEPSPAPAARNAVSSRALAPVVLRERASAELVALLKGERAAEPVVQGTARIGDTAGDHVLFILYATSEVRDGWARARADGTYADRRRELDARIATCEEQDEGSSMCEVLDEERYPTDLRIQLARVSVASGRRTIDATHSFPRTSPHHRAQFREIEDRDADGRPEVSVVVNDTENTGQSYSQQIDFFWFDGDTLHPQFQLDRSSRSAGCSSDRTARTGFSFRDRNGDGHPDLGVRWAQGSCVDDDGWPDPSGTLVDIEVLRDIEMAEDSGEPLEDAPQCPYAEGRERYLYDVAADEWRAEP
jgi:hypothetical protein